MKTHATINDAPAVLNTADKAMWVLGFNAALDAMPAAQAAPVAWALFAPNGNIRMWSTDSEAVRKVAAAEGWPLTPLYRNAAGAAQPLDMLRRARVFIDTVHDGEYGYDECTRDELVEQIDAVLSKEQSA